MTLQRQAHRGGALTLVSITFNTLPVYGIEARLYRCEQFTV